MTHIPRGTYVQVRAAAQLRLARDREKGMPYSVLNEKFEQDMREHVTAASRRGDPCLACEQRWPCKTYELIFMPE